MDFLDLCGKKSVLSYGFSLSLLEQALSPDRLCHFVRGRISTQPKAITEISVQENLICVARVLLNVSLNSVHSRMA